MGKYDQQKADVSAYFDKMGISQECSACKMNDWDILEITGKTGVMGHIMYRPLKIYCKNCGRIQEYDADKIGVK
jgi:mRNA-degrading endonuclease HigB of HigAB toxin-antitoxin module